ncbi:hypothetical protein JAO76_18150 [Pontibacter sp. BT310]|uniref:Uncharacterized protein n=1 Tax=Pontibacter populi TaxID=890055 RepID=A0ABS6XGF8_9BACT|nr:MULTISPECIES: hypothetical protein [Pontibacter]MBJ6120133.1 hypothetical protein [Pontibacter sp. BT310]MBR0572566.1 hypothetical protein [Microvirga sp. STS03]MBW3366986.1 hypothetical protein [Pontibacter populi]
MKIMEALAGGLTGACVLTLTHESLRSIVPEAPRMDILGMRAIAKLMEKAGATPPDDDTLHDWAIIGDVISNGLYYSLAGADKNALLRGTFLGAMAGIGAITLPGPLGLGEAPSERTTQTKVMAVGLYLMGGIVAALAARAIVKATK